MLLFFENIHFSVDHLIIYVAALVRKYEYITHLRVFLSNSLKPTRFQKPHLSYITVLKHAATVVYSVQRPACLHGAPGIFLNFVEIFENSY